MIVPEDLRRTISGWAGDAGRAWLDALPRLVAEVAGMWSLTLGEPYVPSGYTALALRATRADGTPCVLKVGVPDEWSKPEAAALRHFGGGAAVTFLAADADRFALLLERCDPGTPLTAEPDDVATTVIAGLLRELWAPPPEAHLFRVLSRDCEGWAATVRGSDVVDARLRDETLDLLGWLAAAVPDPVVLHGDLHAANVLRARRRPWLVIDPKGAVGDRAFDTAAAIRDRAAPDLVPRRFAILTETLGLDPARVRGWALVQAVEGAAWSAQAGDVAAVAPYVEAATIIAGLGS